MANERMEKVLIKKTGKTFPHFFFASIFSLSFSFSCLCARLMMQYLYAKKKCKTQKSK